MGALAARCSACGTVFRVVQDQLRVAGGLVRCGRCGEVFNAAETLIDLEANAPASVFGSPHAATPEPQMAHPPSDGTDFELQIDAPADAPPGTPEAEAAFAADAASADVAVDEVDPAGESDGAGAAGGDPLAPSAPGAPADDSPMDLDLDLRATSAHPLASGPEAAGLPDLRADDSVRVSPQPLDLRAGSEYALEATPAVHTEGEAEAAPSFVRTADRAQRWRQPRVRAALAAGCALSLLLLAGQAAYTWRDQLAATTPELRGPLLAACSALGCRIEPVRAIDSLAVDNSGLVRVEKSNLYRLQVTLRNRAGQPVAVPALDVTLNDHTGKPLARRVLRAAELGVTEATLAAGRGLPVQATLQTQFPGNEAVTGYTIELFYP